LSEIRANTVSDAAGTGPATLTGQYAAKAWVNFNGTGTVAIRESGNVSSITDNNTGDYTLNFTSALADANYAVSGTQGSNSGASATSLAICQATPTTSAVRMNTIRTDTSATLNLLYVHATVTR